MSETKTISLTEAYDVLCDAIHAKDECPNWESVPLIQLTIAEQRQITALEKLRDVAIYLGIE